jgi:hypothetical protein
VTPWATGFIVIIASDAHYQIQMPQEEEPQSTNAQNLNHIQATRWTRSNTVAGHIAQNKLDTHTDTCCAGANWSLME